MNQKNLLEVDWSLIPAPTDDGAADHLVGQTIPPIALVATDDTSVTLSALPGGVVVFAYPRTGEPGESALVDDWDLLAGVRPQSCAPAGRRAGGEQTDGADQRRCAHHLRVLSGVPARPKRR